ncbi:MAG: hypothetical protein ABL857_07900, partial [Rickettsiales bacterium]
FIFNSAWSYSTNTKSDMSSTTQVVTGTYVYHDNIEQPMLIISSKNGSWSFVNTIPDAENGAYLYTVRCIDKICLSTGAIETEHYYWPTNHRRPLFMLSNDRGNTWSAQNISGLPPMTDGIAPYMSCTDNMCTAVGWYQSNSGHSFPLILTSRNSGQSWFNMQNVAHLPIMQYGELSAISCAGGFCAAGGTYSIQHDDEHLLFLTSGDNGQSWSFVQNIVGLPNMETAHLKMIKCNNNTCVAAGNYTTRYDDKHALLLASHDKGQTWTFVNEIPDLSHLEDLSIDDLTYTNGSYIAVGGYLKAGDKGFLQSLILISKDNGESWSLVKDITGSQSKKLGWLKSVSCNSNTCVAGGEGFYDSGFNFGLTLLVSKDDGKSWSLIPYVAGTAYTPDINVVQCSENYCTATGNFTDNAEYSHPVLLVSDNQGQEWSVVENIFHFPQNVYKVHFSSAASLGID